ncbi:MAG TPA: hypothetical protein VFR25_01620 [Candidatus Eisenbacteria bacterium]|nr:hypothetical protein [Candidatus Eisenbacteria bacterium]
MKRLSAAAWAAGLLLAAGCASTHTSGNDFQVTNRSDYFEFKIGTAKTFTMSQNYAWWNPDSSAVVRQGSDIQGGEALVEVRDADGSVVHSKNLSEQGTMVSLKGKPGMWSVKVTLDKASGLVRFQIEGK